MSAVRALFVNRPELLQGRWIPSPDPEVDVIVSRLDGGVISIEVTRLHPSGGEAARKWEGTQARILSDARKLHSERGFPVPEVVVFWNNWVDPAPEQRRTILALADFVRDHLPPRGEAVGFDSSRDDVRLPRGVDAIELRRFFEEDGHWHAPQYGFLPTISVEQVEERIAVKEARLAKYKAKYTEHWLLLVAGGEGRSTWGQADQLVLRHTFAATFNRVLLLILPGQVYELSIRSAI